MKRIALALTAFTSFLILFEAWHRACAHPPGHPSSTCSDCLPKGVQVPPAPWTTPNYHTCTPMFAAGAPFAPDQEYGITVIRLEPIISGPPKELPPQRPITAPLVRPKRIDVDVPPDVPPGVTSVPPTIPPRVELRGRLQLVLLVDSDAKEAGKTHAAGAELFEQLLKAGIRKERIGTVVKLTTEYLTAETITSKLADLQVKPEDALVIYYAGAAEYDENAMSFMLTPSKASKKISRDDVKKAAVQKKAQLTVLLSDPAANPAIAEPPGKPQTPESSTTALEGLFFGTRGLVDVHGSSVGEFAAARGNYGGCFTIAFVREFARPAGGWADMLENVKFTTNNMFKSYRLDVLKADDVPAPQKALYRNQESQVPAVLTPLENLTPVKNGAALPARLLTPEPLHQPTRIAAKLPAGGQVWIDGQLMAQSGSERIFDLPSSDASRAYELRLEINGWAGVYRVPVVSGETIKVDLQVPTEVVAGS